MLKRPFLLTILAAFLFVFSSCDKDDDNDSPKLEGLLAQKEWRLTSHKVKHGSEAEESVLNFILDNFSVEEITFKLDGEGKYMIYSEGEPVQDGTYEIKGNKIKWDYPATFTWLNSEVDVHEYTLEVSGNTLKMLGDTQYEDLPLKETATFTAE